MTFVALYVHMSTFPEMLKKGLIKRMYFKQIKKRSIMKHSTYFKLKGLRIKFIYLVNISSACSVS